MFGEDPAPEPQTEPAPATPSDSASEAAPTEDEKSSQDAIDSMFGDEDEEPLELVDAIDESIEGADAETAEVDIIEEDSALINDSEGMEETPEPLPEMLHADETFFEGDEALADSAPRENAPNDHAHDADRLLTETTAAAATAALSKLRNQDPPTPHTPINMPPFRSG